MNSSQSIPAHSLCQTLGQCRRAKKATEQCNSEGAKNGGKRSGKKDTYPSLPSSRVFAQLFSIRFPYYLEAWNRLSNAQHSDRSTSKKVIFHWSQRLTLICFLNVVHGSVFFKAAWIIYIKKRQIKTNDWQREGESKNIIVSRQSIQLNLSTTANLGTEESSHCKEVAVVGRSEIWVNVWTGCRR